MGSAVAAAIDPGRGLQVERLERLSYLAAGVIMIALVATGFRRFYLHGLNVVGRPVTQPIAGLVYVHGTLMTAWVIFFIVQSSLIVRGDRSLHMKLGAAGFVLYLLIVPAGVATALLSAHYGPANAHSPWGPQRFLAVPLAAMVGFAILVGIGLVNRHKPAVHRPMMMMGTLFTVAAGIARIRALHRPFIQASHGSIFAAEFMPVIAVAILLGLLKLAFTRRWDRYYAVGFSVMVLVSAAFAYFSATSWWFQLTSLLRR